MASVALTRGAGRSSRRATALHYVVPQGPRNTSAKSKGAQEAHEAIRPTSASRATRTVAGQRAGARAAPPLPADLAARAGIADGREGAGDDDGRPGGRSVRPARSAPRGRCSTASAAVYTEGTDDTTEEAEATLPELAGGRAHERRRRHARSQHFTQPPPRYTEATLIKALEERGIGRPSTYAATISTIIDRGYVTVVERRLQPEYVGEVVTDLLVEHFGDFVDYDFTARMEEELDEIAGGEREWVPLLREFYDPFVELVDLKKRGAEALRLHDRGDRRGLLRGPPDGHPPRPQRPLPGLLAVSRAQGDAATPRGGGRSSCRGRGRRRGVSGVRPGRRSSRDAAASGRSPVARATPTASTSARPGRRRQSRSPFEVACPKCGEGQLTARRARRTGSVFYGCSRYPKCDFTSSREPVGALHDADDGPVAREGDEGVASASSAARRSTCPRS